MNDQNEETKNIPISEYIILEEDNSESLENKVQDKLKEGFIPKDSLKVVSIENANDTGLIYVQAMVKNSHESTDE